MGAAFLAHSKLAWCIHTCRNACSMQVQCSANAWLLVMAPLIVLLDIILLIRLHHPLSSQSLPLCPPYPHSGCFCSFHIQISLMDNSPDYVLLMHPWLLWPTDLQHGVFQEHGHFSSFLFFFLIPSMFVLFVMLCFTQRITKTDESAELLST